MQEFWKPRNTRMTRKPGGAIKTGRSHGRTRIEHGWNPGAPGRNPCFIRVQSVAKILSVVFHSLSLAALVYTSVNVSLYIILFSRYARIRNSSRIISLGALEAVISSVCEVSGTGKYIFSYSASKRFYKTVVPASTPLRGVVKTETDHPYLSDELADGGFVGRLLRFGPAAERAEIGDAGGWCLLPKLWTIIAFLAIDK